MAKVLTASEVMYTKPVATGDKFVMYFDRLEKVLNMPFVQSTIGRLVTKYAMGGGQPQTPQVGGTYVPNTTSSKEVKNTSSFTPEQVYEMLFKFSSKILTNPDVADLSIKELVAFMKSNKEMAIGMIAEGMKGNV